MLKTLSRLISIILHPIVMPCLGIFLMIESGNYMPLLSWNAKKYILLIVFITSFALPLSLIPFIYYRSITRIKTSVNDYQKLYPLLVTIIFYFFGYFILSRIGTPAITGKFMLSCLILAFTLLIISTKWNISLHMAGIGSLAGSLLTVAGSEFYDLRLVFMAVILASGLLGFSRLHLNMNRQWEVYTGFAAGFSVFFIILSIF
jgi:hypothetical protein